jgi:spermidine synthase
VSARGKPTRGGERRAPRRKEALDERSEPRDRSQPEWVVAVLAGVFLLSGTAGLVHEVVWVRLLGHIFGATSLAVSTVLAAFMGGLALGSHWIGTRCERLGDRRRTYALLEIGIGVSALLIPFVLDVVQPLYGWLWRRTHASFAALGVVRFVLAGGILLVPTAMMGATLPVLADYCAGLRGRRLGAEWLYTVNLVGAVLGVALAGFVLMPAIGLWGTILSGAVLNVAIGLVVLRLPALAERASPAPVAAAVRARPSRLLLVAALVSGVLSLAAQVAWTRVLVLVLGSTTYAFSTVLLVYLVALGVGSTWASRRGTRRADVRPALAAVHLVMALGLLGAVAAVERLPYWYVALAKTWQPDSLPATVALNTAVVFGILIVPILAAGTILPLALIGALPRDGEETGAVVGTIYAVNTLGAILGAVLGGFVLIPVFGSQNTLLGVAGVAVAMGVVFAIATGRGAWRVAAAVGAAAFVVGLFARPEWKQQALNAGVWENSSNARGMLADQTRLLYHHEGRTATVTVSEWLRSGTHSLAINARVNASDGRADMVTQVSVAQIPLLLAPRIDDVFVIGWGSGVSVGVALQSPVRTLTAVELEPAVVEASGFFQHVNHDPLRDPRLRLYEDDARHILLASEDTYDVILSEPSHPWVPGVSGLFTEDFFRLGESRLRPDGVFAQWVQTYQLSFDTYRSILATFQSVFPEVLVFGLPNTGDSILIGSRQPLRFDFDAMDQRWSNEATRAAGAAAGFMRPEYLLAAFFLGPDVVRRIVRDSTINTDDNMRIEFQSPKEIFRRVAETSDLTFATLERESTPLEAMFADPSTLTANRERVGALVDGYVHIERDPARYKKLLATLK